MFSKLGLSGSINKALEEKGYKTPTSIQTKVIPLVINKKDVLASAETGTGKTASFTLPIIDILLKNKALHNNPRALIVAPTRELACQINDSVRTYNKYAKLRHTAVYGGVPIFKQKSDLKRGNDILIATPGRLLDLINRRAVNLKLVEFLVLDEADRMLDMGFINDIKQVISILPKNKQTLLFSATISNRITELSKKILSDAVHIDTKSKNITSANVTHLIHPVDKSKKFDLLKSLINSEKWYQAIIFCKTKSSTDKLVKQFSSDNIKMASIHGDKSQSQRTRALNQFRQGKVQFLAATDVAARGIDIDSLPIVVNMDLPYSPEDYVHRIGRTGRGDSKGNAISLVSADEVKQLIDIEKCINKKIKREFVDGFEPKVSLPDRLKERSFSNNRRRNTKPRSFTAGKRKRTNSNKSYNKPTS